MLQNKHLSKKIYDASWNELIRQLTYKSKWKEKKCLQIDTYYSSSQECKRICRKCRNARTTGQIILTFVL